MAVKTFLVETAAIKAGYAIKNGAAEKGVVIGSDDSANLGVAKGNVAAEESFAVGEQIDVALIGEEVLCIAGGAITKGLKCKSDANGKFADVGAGTNPTVLALEAAAADETFVAVVIAQG